MQDILLTAPLVGENSATQTVSEYEQKIVAEHQDLLALMAKERMNAARRAMFCKPQYFEWAFEDDGLRLKFFLDAGSYATALVRELIQIDDK